MSRILLLVVVCVAVGASHKLSTHHPKFPNTAEGANNQIKRVACSSEHERLRNDIIQESRCGAPRDVFEYLEPLGAHLQVSPSAVWVKRCVGLCDYDTYGSKCVPTRNQTRYIPVRIYNVRTNKEYCSTYAVEEHLDCGCCAGTREQCAAPRIYDPRKCACRCPNRRDKRACRSQPNRIMRWNPSKCVCEEKIRVKKTRDS